MHACLSYYNSKCTGGARTQRGFQGGNAPLAGVRGQRPWEQGPRGGSPWRGPRGRAPGWGRAARSAGKNFILIRLLYGKCLRK